MVERGATATADVGKRHRCTSHEGEKPTRAFGQPVPCFQTCRLVNRPPD